MVVVQHTLGATRINLGYTGVGVFFGLSGYLITSLLLDERIATGRVSLPAFYLRRAARLLPALLLVLVVCDVVFALQSDGAPFKGSLTALSYTANYVQVLEALHVLDDSWIHAYGAMWSLAVEEHFYLLWPLLLLGVTRRWGLRTALTLTLVICVAALVWRLVLALLHAPYVLLSVGSIERADALLYGCAAAMALRLGWRPKSWMLWAGMVAIACSPLVFNRETYPILVLGSAVVGLSTAAVVVGMDYVAPIWLRRCLSLRPLVVIGVLSYGIYLWHGPLMQIVQDAFQVGRGYRAAAVLLAVLLARLSHRYVESRVRSWARRRVARRTLPLLNEPVEDAAKR
jgi:peptidoglycan/LPS O-acetylase OafA/YrhL